jgi:RNA polymerase sigma-70 factor (ECF subfamily)
MDETVDQIGDRTDQSVDQQERLANQFEAHRSRLRAVAYRMLGSLSEADDAVQEAWLHLTRSARSTRSASATNRSNSKSKSSISEIENLGGYLTTVVARICLDMLRSRTSRREEPLDTLEGGEALGLGGLGAVGIDVRIPDPIVSRADALDPEQEALLADSVGLALLVVLETLAPAERLAFVLHDMFGVPFEEIAPIVGRSATAARQLASRARRRVQGKGHRAATASVPNPDADLNHQRAVVDAFLAAARGGDFERLLAVLDPEIVLRVDRGGVVGRVEVGAGGAGGAGASRVLRGAHAVAEQSLNFARLPALAERVQPVIVNGVPGVIPWLPDGRPFAILAFTVRGGKIVEINILSDPARLRELDLESLRDWG